MAAPASPNPAALSFQPCHAQNPLHRPATKAPATRVASRRPSNVDRDSHGRLLAGVSTPPHEPATEPVALHGQERLAEQRQQQTKPNGINGIGAGSSERVRRRGSMFDNVPVQTVSGDGSYTAVLVVPTGIGAAIGGYAGDALPVAR